MTNKTLYQNHLESQGFATTRAADLSRSIKALHYAVCELDLSQLKVAHKKLLNLSVKDLINKFGEIEELKRDF